MPAPRRPTHQLASPRPAARVAWLCALALLAWPAAAGALVVGLSDQQAGSWQDPRLRALGLGYARLVVPWDAATSEPGQVQAWLSATSAAGLRPHVAFEHRLGEQCPASPCAAPSRAQYAQAVRLFIARFPQVTTYTTWNEANHTSQPVASRPEAVAGYYEALRAACPGCTIVAGDVVDSGSYVRWLRDFQAATTSNPQLWGLHNWSDVTYGTASGTDAALAAVPGQLWLEETGGIVTRRDAAGRQLLATDERRAASAVDQAFAIARARPRITRMYIYQWRAVPLDRFDAGLVRPDGTTRPSYDAMVRNLAVTAAAVPAMRWTATWSRARPGRLVVRGTCPANASACRGRVTIALRTRARGTGRARSHRLAVRAYRTTAARRRSTLRLQVSAKLRALARRAARRTLMLVVQPSAPAGGATRTAVDLRRPSRSR